MMYFCYGRLFLSKANSVDPNEMPLLSSQFVIVLPYRFQVPVYEGLTAL